MARKAVSVLVGAGSIGLAIIRRVSAGRHIVLADYSAENAQKTARTLEDAGFVCSTIKCDLGAKEDILRLVEFATSKGDVVNLVNAAGVSPSQAPVEEILRVDLYGTSVLLEEFGKVIAEGGSGVIISSQSGHRLPASKKCPTMVFVKTTNGYRFGGFTTILWTHNSFGKDNKAFLFSLDRKEKYNITTENCANYLDSGSSFWFGGAALRLYNNCTSNKSNYVSNGSFTTVPANYAINGGEQNFTVSSYEVYQIEY